MPKLRLSTLQDPIEFDVPGGKTYQVREITEETIARIGEIGAESAGGNLGHILDRQLSEFTGADPAEFADVPLRHKIAVRDFVMQAFVDPLGTRVRAGARPQ